ncbi:hypothetical protein QUB68_16725 [Microcoleus sp. A006_D1]
MTGAFLGDRPHWLVYFSLLNPSSHNFQKRGFLSLFQGCKQILS